MAYTALVLSEESHDKLVLKFGEKWESDSDWTTFAHHVTLHLGRATEAENKSIGDYFTIIADAYDGNDKVKALRVILPNGVMTKNKTPHITLAVNLVNDGKPFMSNQLNDWTTIEPIRLRGRLEEVE